MSKTSCLEGSADACISTDGSVGGYQCMCGTNGQCSGTTPKCDNAICVKCDETFCKQPLPTCITTGADEGSCRCGTSDTCGTADQLGNRCDDAGNCLCGEDPLCTTGSTVGTCLNNVVPPVFEAGDTSSTCKCSADSCDKAGKVLSNGACSNVAGN